MAEKTIQEQLDELRASIGSMSSSAINPPGSSASAFSGTLGTTGSSVSVPTNEYVKEQVAASKDLNAYEEPATKSGVDMNQTFDELVSKMSSVAKEQLSGVISSDVQAQIKQISAENAMRAGLGLGSQASKFITARDLGRTSADIQQQGMSNAQAVSQLAEAKREYNKNYTLSVKQYLQDVRGTDLNASQLVEMSRQFNVDKKIQLMSLAADVLNSYHNIAYGYASNSEANAQTGANMAADYTKLITQLKGMA